MSPCGSGRRLLVSAVVVLCSLCVPLVLRGACFGLGIASGLVIRATLVRQLPGRVAGPPWEWWGVLERGYGGPVPWCFLVVIDVVED